MARRISWWAWPVVLAVVIVAPLLVSRGFWLVGDMVFVPRQPWKAAWLGLDGSVPRSVPGDAVVSLLTHVAPGDVVQKAILVAVLAGAGAGVARLVRRTGKLASAAAATLYIWNPYVFERLDIGHWALLCSYAALPWVVLASDRVRHGDPRGWAWLTLLLAITAWTSPTGGVIAALVAVAHVAGRGRLPQTAACLGVALVVNLPWIVPSVLYPGGIPADPAGVDAFAARADTPYGTLGSLLSLGGIWKATVVPPGRASWILSGLTLALAVAALIALARRGSGDAPIPLTGLAVAAGVGVLVAVLPSVPWGAELTRWLVEHLPGGGLLRDSQKWIAPLALLEAVGVAVLVASLRRRFSAVGRLSVWWAAALGVGLPIAALPVLGWGLGGRAEAVEYPDEWTEVAAAIRQQADSGDLAVLPWSTYRRYGWNGDRALLDPAPRFFDVDVVVDDVLYVDGRPVAGEDARASSIRRLLAGGGPVTEGLRDRGVGLVLLEHGTPGLGSDVRLDAPVLHDGPLFTLWRISEPAAVHRATPPAGAVIAADAISVALVAGSATWLAVGAVARYTRRYPRSSRAPRAV